MLRFAHTVLTSAVPCLLILLTPVVSCLLKLPDMATALAQQRVLDEMILPETPEYLYPDQALPEIVKSGASQGHEHWTADSKYRIEGEYKIYLGDSLSIDAGVWVGLAPGAILRIDGALVVQGTADNPVYFTRADPAAAFARLMIMSGSTATYDDNGDYAEGCYMRHAIIEGGGEYGGMFSEGQILISEGSPYLCNLTIRWGEARNGGGIAFISESRSRLENSLLYGNLSSGNGGAVFVDHNTDPVLAGNTIVNNTAGNDGGGVFLAHSNGVLYRNIIQSNTAGRDGGGVLIAGSSPTLRLNLVRYNQAEADGDNVLIHSGTTPVVFNNAFVAEAGETTVATKQHTAESTEIKASHNYWGAADPVQVRSQKLDSEQEPARPTLLLDPILEAPVDSIAGHEATIDTVMLYEDPDYQLELQTDYIGHETQVYLRVLGEGENPRLVDWALVDMIAAGRDTIRLLTPETGPNSNEYRMMIRTSSRRDPDRFIVNATIGDKLYLKPVNHPEKTLETEVRFQQPFVRDLALKDVKDLEHMIDDSVVATWSFEEPQRRPQIALKMTVLDTFDAVFWESGEVRQHESKYRYHGPPFTPARDFILRVETTNGKIWSEPADILFHRNAIPAPPTPAIPAKGQVFLTTRPILQVRSETDPEGDSLFTTFLVRPEKDLGRILRNSGEVVQDTFRTAVVQPQDDPTATIPARSAHLQPPDLDRGKLPMEATWQVGEPLDDNAVYTMAAFTTDHWETTDTSQAVRFIVNRFNDVPGEFAIQWPEQMDEVLPTDRITWSQPFDPDPEEQLTYSISLGTAFLETDVSSVVAGELQGINGIGDDVEVPLTIRVSDLEGATRIAVDSARVVVYNAVNDTPTVPTGFNLVEGQRVPTYPANLAWRASSDEDQSDPASSLVYDVELSRIWGEKVAVLRTGPGVTNMDLTPIQDNWLAYWRVRAVDNTEAQSAWSPPVLLEVNAVNDTPTVPTGFNLEDGQIVREVPAYLEWEASTDADESDSAAIFEYEVELRRKSGALLGVLRTRPGQTGIHLDPVQDNWLADWRVRTIDDEGAASDWSSTRMVEVNRVNDMPTTPDGFTLSDSQRAFQYPAPLAWDASSDLDESDPPSSLIYQVELVRENGDSIGVLTTAPGQTEIDLDPVEDNSRALWRVRAIDDESGASPWSSRSTLEVNVKDDNPNAFALLTPENDARPYSLGPTTFTWEEAIDIDPLNTVTYIFYLSESRGFDANKIVAQDTTGALTYTYSPDLKHLHDYYWKVEALDNTGLSTWSDVFTFRVISTPTAPLWTGEWPMEVTPTYRAQWEASTDPDPRDVLAYRVEVSASESFPEGATAALDPVSGTEAALNQIPGLGDVVVDNGPLVIRVKARDDQGFEGPWSTISGAFINFENDTPEPPALVFPSNDRLDNTRPTFQWYAGKDADHTDPPKTLRYEIWIAPAESPDTPVAVGNAMIAASADARTTADMPVAGTADNGALTWRPPDHLPDNSELVWKMRTFDDENTASEWTGLTAFSIDRKPEKPGDFDLMEPANEAALDPNTPITFTWTASTDPDLDSHVQYNLVVGDREFGPMDETTFTLEEGLPAGKYKWRVAAVDNTGLTNYSKSSFRMVVGQP